MTGEVDSRFKVAKTLYKKFPMQCMHRPDIAVHVLNSCKICIKQQDYFLIQAARFKNSNLIKLSITNQFGVQESSHAPDKP